MTLHRDPSLGKTLVTLKSMMRAFRENGERVLLELESLTATKNKVGEAVPDSLQELLTEFKQVFEEPGGSYLAPEVGPCDYTATKGATSECSALSGQV